MTGSVELSVVICYGHLIVNCQVTKKIRRRDVICVIDERVVVIDFAVSSQCAVVTAQQCVSKAKRALNGLCGL